MHVAHVPEEALRLMASAFFRERYPTEADRIRAHRVDWTPDAVEREVISAMREFGYHFRPEAKHFFMRGA